jgi:PAS domain S-box-containing protein
VTSDSPRVLYIEDNEATRYVVNRVLAGAGFRVVSTGIGERGIALAREELPDLALVDVRLPDQTGFDVCRTLKADPVTAGIPVVFLSASHVAPEDHVQGLEGGADMYLTHPVEPHVLVATLHALLRVRYAEGRYRSLVRANVVGVVEFDLDGRVLEANDEYLRQSGLTREEVASGNARWDALVPPETREDLASRLGPLRSGGSLPPFEGELLRRDGARLSVVTTAAGIGRSGRGVAIVIDQSDRRRVEREREQALARAEAAQHRLAFLVSVSSSLIGDPTRVSNALIRVAGLCAGRIADWCAIDRIVSKGVVERVAVAAADPTRQAAALALARGAPAIGEGATGRALATGTPEHLQDVRDPALLQPASDPAIAAALATLGVRAAAVHPLVADGRVLGSLTLVRSSLDAEMSPLDAALGEEVAARAAVALENARLHEALALAVRAREDALAEVSHELRNPLSSVLLGIVQLERAADRPDLAELVRRRAGSIRRASERMSRLVDDLLDLARFEAGRLSIELSVHDAAEVVHEVVEAIAHAARERRVALESSVDPGLALACDRERVHRVLVNLVTNAIGATPEGTCVELSARASPGGAIVSVRDQGPGIPPEIRDRLFERYWRGREKGGGVGLGLSIAKALVESHGGRIWFDSAIGGGTTFSFLLPRPPGQLRARESASQE